MKRTVLAQEALRILLNCSRDLPWDVKAAHLTTLSARMQFSGYPKQFGYHAVASGVKAYNTLREEEERGKRPLYRPREYKRAERDQAKAEKKMGRTRKVVTNQ